MSFLGLMLLRKDVSLGGLSKARGRMVGAPYSLWGSVSNTTSAEKKKKKRYLTLRLDFNKNSITILLFNLLRGLIIKSLIHVLKSYKKK